MSTKVTKNTLENDKRMSTRQLLQFIYQKIDEGCNEFDILASGQHDIGGPLHSKNGEKLIFRVKNPGQRVGSMGMPNTEIIVEGSAPADTGWLNSGAVITVKGDSGDTTAHCAASGKIYIGGRVGTRSGALMKHDPKFPAPELWVLKNTGSFGFEFTGGGTAVICGYGCENMSSVLGERACVGMVGGVIYFRGHVRDLSKDVYVTELNEEDFRFLEEGMKEFLTKIEHPELYEELTKHEKWHKILPQTEKATKKMSLKEFRQTEWVKGGIFEDVFKDDLEVISYINTGKNRLRVPEWQNDKYLAPCAYSCPIGIPTMKRIALIREGKIDEAINLAGEYTPFPESVCGNVCPNLCMSECGRKSVDEQIKVDGLGMLSKGRTARHFETTKPQKVAIIGAGAAGLACAYKLRQSGYSATVFEEDKKIGGKLSQVIPKSRLSAEILEEELKRLKEAGIEFRINEKITAEKFEKIKSEFDATVIATGAHKPVVLPIEGKDRLIKGLEFLKKVNNGESPKVGEKVVVIGAGNAAMDVVIEAYNAGAKEVTAVDIQKPSAFEKEINHAKSLGAKILYPKFTQKITAKGIEFKDGEFLAADTVIIAIGDRPDLSMLDKNCLTERKFADTDEFLRLKTDNTVFVAGDAVKQGLFTEALADGRNIAMNIENMFSGRELSKFEKKPMIDKKRVKSEYYNSLRHSQIESMNVLDEKDRCLSCGKCRDCEMCLNACPQGAIEKRIDENGETEYYSNDERCIGCGICAGVCPCGIWAMKDNFEFRDNPE